MERFFRTLYYLHHSRFSFVIFWTTYVSDADWATFLSALEAHVRKGLESSGWPYRLPVPCMPWAVIEDRKELEGKSKGEVRELFIEWVRETGESGDGQGEGARKLELGLTPRYRQGTYADEEVVKNVIEKASLDFLDPKGPAWVVLINTPSEIPARVWADDDEENYGEEEFEDIEGSRDGDVGWIKAEAVSLNYIYNGLHGSG